MEQREFIVEQETAGQRIDRFLSGEDTGLSRSALQALVAEGHVQCNGKAVAKSLKLKAGDTVLLEIPDAKPIEAASGLTKTMAPRDGNSVEELPIPRIQSNPREYYANVFDYLEGKADILVKNEQVMRVLRVIELALESAAKNQALDFE
mgnify:CR=1 FL=1